MSYVVKHVKIFFLKMDFPFNRILDKVSLPYLTLFNIEQLNKNLYKTCLHNYKHKHKLI